MPKIHPLNSGHALQILPVGLMKRRHSTSRGSMQCSKCGRVALDFAVKIHARLLTGDTCLNLYCHCTAARWPAASTTRPLGMQRAAAATQYEIVGLHSVRASAIGDAQHRSSDSGHEGHAKALPVAARPPYRVVSGPRFLLLSNRFS
jgi:hypothetical protein